MMTKHNAARVSTPARRSLRVAGALLALLVVALPAVAGDWGASGQVRYQNGQPAANATVTLRSPSGNESTTQSDGNGNYSISISEPSGSGTALLWAELGSLTSETVEVMDMDVTMNLTLSGN
jgi:hypothetical protein